jgi:hypothetical protein
LRDGRCRSSGEGLEQIEEVQPVTEANLSMMIDDVVDDLPRTFRRERDARERAKREEEERKRAATLTFSPDTARYDGEGVPAVVTRFDVPFGRLMLFYIKAVFAAIPALILLGGLLWLAGDVLRTLFPWLIKMQILIRFPG